MSRSYKKSPVYTDGSRKTTKWVKRMANHKVRRHERRITDALAAMDRRYVDARPFDGKSYRKFSESWWIHDYISYWEQDWAVNEYEHPNWRYDEFRNEWWHRWDQFKSVEEMKQFWAKYYRRK